MTRFERWFWTLLYFGVGVALASTLLRLSDHSSLRTAFHIATFVVAASWLRFWAAFKRSIVRNLGWGARIAIIRVRERLNPVLLAWIRRHTPRSEVAGFIVYADASSDEQRAERVRRLGAALEDIRSIWPVRYERLSRLSPMIYVGWLPGGGGFFYGTNVIGVHESIVDLWQPESVACILCHELSHMYVAARGVKLTPLAESRFERIADLEMRLWGLRLLNANRANAQSSTELMTLIRESRRRWWWRRDGSRVHGSEWEKATRAATASGATAGVD